MSDVAPEIKVGDTAPDFNLKDQDQKDVKLSEYRARRTSSSVFTRSTGARSVRGRISV